MRILRSICLIGFIGAGLTLRAQNLPTMITSEPAPPPPTRARVQGPPPSRPGTPNADGTVRISGGVMAGQLIHRVDPIYPATDAQGAVVLHAIIAPNGTVQQLSVISGPPPLVRAAVDAVRQWTYNPYLLNGEPTAVDTTIVVNFKR